MNPAFEVIGFASGILGLSIAVPQLVRVLRSRSREGVSLATWLITLALFSLFGAYGFRYGSLSQTVTNAIACLLTCVLVFVLARYAWGSVGALGVTAGTVLGFFSLAYFTPVWVMTVAIFGMVLVGKVPQIIASWRHCRQGENTVVSKTTYVLILVSSGGWVAYGLLTGLWHNVVTSSFNIVASLLILFYETRNREVVPVGERGTRAS